PGPGTSDPARGARWRRLRSAAPVIYPVQAPAIYPGRGPALGADPWPRSPLGCAVCRGPVRPGFSRCYQCERHTRLAPGLLADVVVPISYAVKGTALAADLWRYKSWPAPSARARTSVLALLLAFLHDHGACVWRRAGMPGPGRLAVVPTGCGRPGPHPLLELASPYLRLRPAGLVLRPGRQGRDLNVHRFHADQQVAGAGVLLLDDSWVSGGSAQSAAAALKLAGARHVAIVVLGRHLDPADAGACPPPGWLTAGPYDPSRCAVHGPWRPGR
ncbi:MAG: hypothetical protein M3Z75_22995, partial [Actinomycetota bacterium]|nr:hypothetical protein [Actinomycetota bacterium]